MVVWFMYCDGQRLFAPKNLIPTGQDWHEDMFGPNMFGPNGAKKSHWEFDRNFDDNEPLSDNGDETDNLP
jgi:hypothetical protein